MRKRARAARTLRLVLSLGFAALAAEDARAADCFAPIAKNDKWTCTAALSTGDTVAYCLNLVRTLGEGAARSFDLIATGPSPRRCTCGAKGKGPDARHNTAVAYLCFDETADATESGTITRRRIAGQFYDMSRNLRATVRCQPDPACVVPLQ